MVINALELLNSYLGRSAIGAALGGAGAIAYNQFTDNDVNPFLAAGAVAGLGAGAKFAYNKADELMEQYANNNLQSYKAATTQTAQPVANVQVPDNNQWVNIPQENLDVLRNQSKPISQFRQVDNILEETAKLRHQLRLINQGQNSTIPPQSPILRPRWDEQQQRLQAIQSLGQII